MKKLLQVLAIIVLSFVIITVAGRIGVTAYNKSQCAKRIHTVPKYGVTYGDGTVTQCVYCGTFIFVKESGKAYEWTEKSGIGKEVTIKARY